MSYPAWLPRSVAYQVYPQSFADSNGDGIGDLPGLLSKLDYLQDLGVDLIWLNPVFASPFRDAGYDVADYLQVAPRYGTNEDLETLIAELHRRGMRILLDLVPGHTSDQHPWFKRASEGETNEMTDRYIWSDSPWATLDDGLRFISGVADHGSFAINFFAHQPALNWGFARPDKPYQQSLDDPAPRATRDAIREVMAYWLDRGVDGFRVDMASSLVKNDAHYIETRGLWRYFREWMDANYEDRVLLAEWGVPEMAVDGGFHVDFMLHFGAPGYADLFFNEFGRRTNTAAYFDPRGRGHFDSFYRHWRHHARRVIGEGVVSIPSSNHDFQRPAFGPRGYDDLSVIFAFLMTWPCLPFVYYGDEIGMRYIEGMISKEGGYDRTGSRTPMQWDRGPTAGFSTAPPERLYVPIDPDPARPDVASQQQDERSLWRQVQRLIALRRAEPALVADAPLEVLTPTDPGYPLAYRRGDLLVVLNPSAEAQSASLELAHDAEPLAVRGIDVRSGEGQMVAEAGPQSYGVFRLK